MFRKISTSLPWLLTAESRTGRKKVSRPVPKIGKSHGNEVRKISVLQYVESQLSGKLLIIMLFRWDALKGLGHAILGNFSTGRMDIELTKISK